MSRESESVQELVPEFVNYLVEYAVITYNSACRGSIDWSKFVVCASERLYLTLVDAG